MAPSLDHAGFPLFLWSTSLDALQELCAANEHDQFSVRVPGAAGLGRSGVCFIVE